MTIPPVPLAGAIAVYRKTLVAALWGLFRLGLQLPDIQREMERALNQARGLLPLDE